MSNIHYAIEIFTSSTLTNTSYGLVDGVFRFVTDRPKYDIGGWYAYGEIWCDVDSPTILGGTGRIGFEAISPGTTWHNFYINIWHKSHNPFNPNQTGIYWANTPSPGIVNIYIDTTTTVSDVVNGNLINISGTPLFTLSEITPGTIITQTTYAYFNWIVFLHNYTPYDVNGILPTYSAYEIDKNGVSVSGQPVNANFYEGFLLKEFIETNPGRSIDIISCGSCSTDCEYSFKLRNNNNFVNFINDPLNTGSFDLSNAISLAGKNVVLWVSINDVFYQIARGKITDNPYSENNFTIKVENDSVLLCKNIPPVTKSITNSSDSGALQAEEDVSVVFGDVPYAKILKMESETNYDTLAITINGEDSKVAASCDYTHTTAITEMPTGSTIYTGLSTVSIKLYYELSNSGAPGIEAHALAGKYLSVISGLNADTDTVYQITDNDATTSGNPRTTQLYLASPIIDTSTDLPYNTTTYSSSCAYKYDVGSGIHNSDQNTFWFKVSDLSITAKISNSDISAFGGIYSFNSDNKKYTSMSNIIDIYSKDNNNLVLKLNANTASIDGKISMFFPVSISPEKYGIYDYLLGTLEEYDAISLLTDQDKTKTPFQFTTTFNTPYGYNYLYLYCIYDISNLLNDDFDEIFFCTDFDISGFSGSSNFQYCYYNSECLTVRDYDQYNAMDTVYPRGNYSRSDINFINYRGSQDVITVASGGTLTVNTFPNEYYKFIKRSNDFTTANAISMFDYPIVGSSPRNLSKFTTAGKNVFTTSGLSKMFCGIGFTFVTTGGKLSLKQMGLMGKNKIDTLAGDVYTRVQGETTGGLETNTVYTAIKHIMEDYDNIPTALIDYGNLQSTRGNTNFDATTGTLWHVGRVLTDRKNSIDYLSELCANSFVGMFTSRTGKISFKSYRNFNSDGIPSILHDNSLILRDSIDSFKKSDISQLYNSFKLSYNYDYGIKDFTRSFFVANVDKYTTFPAETDYDYPTTSITTSTTSRTIGNGLLSFTIGTNLNLKYGDILKISYNSNNYMVGSVNQYSSGVGSLAINTFFYTGSGTYAVWSIYNAIQPTWYNCFGGVSSTPAFSGIGYTEAQYVWNLCRYSYTVNNIIRQAQNDISELQWYIDRSIFSADTTWGTEATSSAYYYLVLLAQWTTLQKYIVKYSVPITTGTILLELLDYIGFSDAIYTNNEVKYGYITGLEIDTTEDKINITLVLLPDEMQPNPLNESFKSRLMSVQAAPLTNASII